MYLLFLVIFTIIMSYLDYTTNIYYKRVTNKISFKEKMKLIGLLILHNIIYFTLYFSFFFIIYYYNTINSNYIIIYCFYVFITFLHWQTNNNRCRFTEMQNEILGIDKSIGFRDPYAILFNIHAKNAGTGTLRDQLYYGYIIGAFIISCILYLNKIKHIHVKKKRK